jgi:hypothetical protein
MSDRRRLAAFDWKGASPSRVRRQSASFSSGWLVRWAAAAVVAGYFGVPGIRMAVLWGSLRVGTVLTGRSRHEERPLSRRISRRHRMVAWRKRLPAFAPAGWFRFDGGAESEAEALGGAGCERCAGDEAEAEGTEGSLRGDDAETAVVREIDVDGGVACLREVLEGAPGRVGHYERGGDEFRAGGTVRDWVPLGIGDEEFVGGSLAPDPVGEGADAGGEGAERGGERAGRSREIRICGDWQGSVGGFGACLRLRGGAALRDEAGEFCFFADGAQELAEGEGSR